MRKRHSISVSLLFATLMVWAWAPASAATNGQLDGNAHPAVAFLVATFFDDPDPCVGPVGIGCTGFLIAPDAVLTTANCAQLFTPGVNAPRIWATFDPGEPYDCHNFVPVTEAVIHPGYANDLGANNVGVLTLGVPQTITSVALPEEGSVAALPDDQEFTVVAHATEAENGEGGGPQDFGNIFRRFSAARELALGPELQVLLLRTTESHDSCFGAFTEGGAAFIGSSNTAASIVVFTEFVHNRCSPRGDTQRLDSPSILGFLDDFVTP